LGPFLFSKKKPNERSRAAKAYPEPAMSDQEKPHDPNQMTGGSH